MSEYYGEMQAEGRKTNHHCTAHKGITAHIRGWNHGIRVTMRTINGEQFCEVTKTGGSNNDSDIETLARYKVDDGTN